MDTSNIPQRAPAFPSPALSRSTLGGAASAPLHSSTPSSLSVVSKQALDQNGYGMKLRKMGRADRQVYRVAPLDNAPPPFRGANTAVMGTSTGETKHHSGGKHGKDKKDNKHDGNERNSAKKSQKQVATIDNFMESGKNNPQNSSVVAWKDRMLKEQSGFNSVSTWCEVTYHRVLTETRNMDTPNPLRTAVCCMLLDRLAPLCGDSQSLVKNLLSELYNSIYVEWDEYMKRKFIQVASSATNATEEEAEEDLLEEDLTGSKDSSVSAKKRKKKGLDVNNDYDGNDHQGTNQKMLVASLNQRNTFFESYRQLQDVRIQVVGRPARVLTLTVDIWRQKLLKLAFTFWHSDTLGKKKRWRKIRNTILTTQSRRNNRSVSDHFQAWRTYVFERRHQCRVVYEENSRKKLVYRMGRRIKELEAENKETNESLEKLMEEHFFVANQLKNMENLFETFKKKLNKEENFVAFTSGSFGNSASDVKSGELSAPDAAQRANSPSTARPNNAEDGSPKAAHSSPLRRQSTLSDLIAGEREGVYASNDAALFGKGSPPPSDGPKPTVDEMQPQVDSAMKQPNRIEQLSKYLDLNTPADPQDGAESTSLSAREANKKQKQQPKPESGSISPSAAKALSFLKNSRFTDSPLEPAEKPKANYRDVMDWVSLRIQLILTNNSPVIKRCTNFTNDWKDSIRLGYLLLSLGAEKSLLDELYAAPTLLDRATIAINVARCFFEEHDEMFTTVQMHPVDLVKAKGSKISKLLFGLYEKYNNLPLVLPSGPLNPRLAQALRSANDGVAAPPAVQPIGSAAVDEPTNVEPTSQTRDSVALSNAAVELGAEEFSQSNFVQKDVDAEEENIPDAQFMEWYRDLAADDSDVEEVEEYFEVMERKKSTIHSYASRLHERLSVHMDRAHHKAHLEPVKKKVPIGDRLVAIEGKQNPQAHMLEWVTEKLNLAGDGTETEDQLSTLSNLEMLETLVHGLLPETPTATSNDPKARAMYLQKVLREKLHLRNLKLRPNVAKDEHPVSIKQLMTAIFVANAKGVIAL